MPAHLNTAWIGLGANLPSEAGHPADTLQAASGLYDSAPVDSSGPWYCNQVVRVGTSLDAPALLAALQGIEQAFGRQRPYRNAPRTLDLDVLLFNDEVRTDTQLTLPHPRLHERLFGLGTVAALLERLQATAHGQDCRRMAG